MESVTSLVGQPVEGRAAVNVAPPGSNDSGDRC
jgi:hypothetical protein